MVLSPGFIDMHAHSDLQLLDAPDHYAKLSQGVTTEVLGQDGLSYAPVDDATLAGIRRQIAGWNSDPDDFDWTGAPSASTWTGSTAGAGAVAPTPPTCSRRAPCARW